MFTLCPRDLLVHGEALGGIGHVYAMLLGPGACVPCLGLDTEEAYKVLF